MEDSKSVSGYTNLSTEKMQEKKESVLVSRKQESTILGNAPKNVLTFKWQSPLEDLGIMILVHEEERRKLCNVVKDAQKEVIKVYRKINRTLDFEVFTFFSRFPDLN